MGRHILRLCEIILHLIHFRDAETLDTDNLGAVLPLLSYDSHDSPPNRMVYRENFKLDSDQKYIDHPLRIVSFVF